MGAGLLQAASEPEIVVERARTGRPYAGKVLAAIQAHTDDIPIFAAGTVLKLMNEGYTGYLIRTTRLQPELWKSRDGCDLETGAPFAPHLSFPAAQGGYDCLLRSVRL